MKKTVLLIVGLLLGNGLFATEKLLGSTGTGRWVKVARIQNANPINGGECSTFSGSVNVQTDYGQTGYQQYYAIFSFGSRGGVKPLLQEFGDAADRAVSDLSRIEWRVYTDAQGWHYLWFWQSNYSRFANFDYAQTCGTEYWTFEDPPATYTQVWSSLDGDRQYSNQTLQKLSVNESVGIGTLDPGAYQLAVNGNIHAKEVKVDLIGWPDFVFQKGYKLPTLDQVAQHIKEKGHLINIPSAKEVETNGVELGEMNKLLLEKIEELTLYTLEQEEKIQNLKVQNSKMERENKKMVELESRLEKIEQLLNQNQ